MIWKRTGLFIILLLTVLATQACNLPYATAPVVSAAADAQETPAAPVRPGRLAVTVTLPPNPSATPTPFQPIPPTATPVPTETPTPAPTPTLGIQPQGGEMPPPRYNVEPGGPLPEGVVTFLVLGSDMRPGGGFRTDVIILVSVNRNNNTVSLVSFPRDLYVNIPGWMTNRINTAMQVGGFDLMAATFQSNFGVRPDYYVMTNFDGFKGIIDSLDYINVKVRQPLYDKCDLPMADAYGYCNVEPATVPMNGETALWYVRSRYSSSDFDRTRRAQEVITALFDRLMRLDAVSRAPEIYDIYRRNVETNVGLDQALPLIPVAQEILNNPDRIRRYSISSAQAVPYITPEGAMVLWPDLAAIRAIVYEAVYQ